MRSSLTLLFVAGCIALIITGGYGYAKGRIELHRQAYIAKAFAAEGYDARPEDENIKQSVTISLAMLIAGGLGVFAVIYNSNKPDKKKRPYNYKY